MGRNMSSSKYLIVIPINSCTDCSYILICNTVEHNGTYTPTHTHTVYPLLTWLKCKVRRHTF